MSKINLAAYSAYSPVYDFILVSMYVSMYVVMYASMYASMYDSHTSINVFITNYK